MRSSVIRSGALTCHDNSNERPSSPLDLDHSTRHCAHSIPGSIGGALVGGSEQRIGGAGVFGPIRCVLRSLVLRMTTSTCDIGKGSLPRETQLAHPMVTRRVLWRRHLSRTPTITTLLRPPPHPSPSSTLNYIVLVPSRSLGRSLAGRVGVLVNVQA